MSNDAGMDALRVARIQISKDFGDDPKRLIAHYIALQERYAGQLVHGPNPEPESAAQPAVAPDEAPPRR